MCNNVRFNILQALVVMFMTSSFLISQDTLFHVDFQDQSLGQFVEQDNDGLTLGPDFTGLSGGWNVLPVGGPDDFRAVGVSSFRGGGTADNWLISPAIEITGNGATLRWTGTSLSGDLEMLEDYTVLVSTTDDQLSSFIPIRSFVDESSSGTTREMDLSGFNGQTIYFAFNQNGTDDYALTLDDISVTVPSSTVSARILGIVGHRYQDVDAPELFLQILNTGSENITDLAVTGRINSDQGDHEFSFLNIAPQDTTLLPFADLYPFGPERYEMEAAILLINGEDASGPMVNSTHYMVAEPPTRSIFYEEATSTSCGWCPEGFAQKELIELNHGEEVIFISGHSDDPMEDIVYKLGLEGQPDFGGYPSVTINRQASVELTSSGGYIRDKLNRVSPFELEFEQEYDDETRVLTVALSGEAHTSMDDENHRFGMLILEDGVSGSTTDYAQANNFSKEAFDVPLVQLSGRDWQVLSDPVSQTQMQYDDVVRVVLGGYDGIISSFSSAENGDKVSYQLDYVIPSVFDEESIHLVAFVVDVVSGEVVAATEQALELPSSTAILAEDRDLEVYPNPAKDMVYLKFNGDHRPTDIRLMDLSGKTVFVDKVDEATLSNTSSIQLNDIPSGYYTLIINTLEQTYKGKLVVID